MPNFVRPTPFNIALFYNNQQGVSYPLQDGTLDAVAAYSVRKLRSNYTGNCLRLRRSNDNAEMDFGFDANGDLDVAAIATFLGANNGFIATWYDQSGNTRNLTAAATTNQPLFVANVVNGKPVLRFDGTDDYLRNTSFVDFGDAYTASMIAAFSSTGDTSQGVFEVSNGATNTGLGIQFYTLSTNRAHWQVRDATTNRRVSGTDDIRDDGFRIHVGHNTGSQLEYWINQVSKGTSIYTAPNPNTLNRLDIGRVISPAGWHFKGDLPELVLFNTQLTEPQRTPMEDNQNDYYNVF